MRIFKFFLLGALITAVVWVIAVNVFVDGSPIDLDRIFIWCTYGAVVVITCTGIIVSRLDDIRWALHERNSGDSEKQDDDSGINS